MKRTFMMFAVLVGVLAMSNGAYGYTFGFTNLMTGPVNIRIKLSGINEPWYTAHLRGAKESGSKGKVYEFEFQVDAKVSSDMKRKFGFCLSQIQVQPYEMGTDGKWHNTGLWYDADPRFVESNYFNKMLQAVAKFNDGFAQAAGSIIKGVADGMSVPQKLKAAQASAQDLAKNVKDRASAKGTKKALGAASASTSDLPLGKIVKGIGGMVAYSLCKDRHFHILPNIDGEGSEQPGPVVTTNAR